MDEGLGNVVLEFCAVEFQLLGLKVLVAMIGLLIMV